MSSSIIYKSFHIGSIRGIAFKIHWSFVILLAVSSYFVFLGKNVAGVHLFIEFFIILFFSVVSHELGHALTAKHLNIKPKDIIISALGGLARIETLKDKPKEEILIALSGPLANFLIFLLSTLYVILFANEHFQLSTIDTFLYTNYFSITYKIAVVNLLLFSLNLIPAFPMDGGRILRGALSLKFGSKQGTRLASHIGRIIALMFFIIGAVYRIYGLIAISTLVYLMAAREAYVDLNQSNK